MPKKTVILSGSGGWLGKTTIENLRQDYELICLSRNKHFIDHYTGNAIYWDGSEHLQNIVADSIYSNSTLVHTASFPYSLYRSENVTLSLAKIIKSEINLFEMLIGKPYPKSIIYVSSSAIHSLENYFSSYSDSTSCKIASKFGIAKFIIEQELIALSKINNLRFSIIRPQSIFSNEEKPSDNKGHLFSDLIYKILIEQESSISISLARNYLMVMTPEFHYTNVLKREINDISHASYIELKNKNCIELEQFIHEVVNYGLSHAILSNKPAILYGKSDAQELEEKVNSPNYCYCNVDPKILIKKYLTKHF